MQIYPVILSGGSGTRLWPLSRAMAPKQFIDFGHENGPSFFQMTALRLTAKHDFEAPIIVCNRDHRFTVKEQLGHIGVSPHAIYLEPAGRNTAAAIAVAALAVTQKDEDAVLAVMPSDHLIKNVERFSDVVRAAAEVAANGKLVLLAIKPESPDTGFGYVKQGSEIKVGSKKVAYKVATFKEKPDVEAAKKYLESGNYYWNGGIFILNAKSYLEELELLAPEILTACKKALALGNMDSEMGFFHLDKDAFEQSPNISIDYAVMEKTKRAAMLPMDVGWNDIGSWSSLWQVNEKDEFGNYATGPVVLEDSSNCLVHAENSLVTALGVDDLIIVETPDAVLVSHQDRAQEVGALANRLKAENRKETENHTRCYRPWGFFERLSMGPQFQVKHLQVKPGGVLSLQMHHHRSEHWVVVNGTARVTKGDDILFLKENESIYIEATQWHRLENPGKEPLDIIEVQIGQYLDESDILRKDDIYNRTNDETK